MAALLARRDRDGLSLRELSEESGIPFGTLSWWSWRLRQAPANATREAGGFVEVVAAARGGHEVILRLGDGVEIEVAPGTDVVWLRDLLTALRSC